MKKTLLPLALFGLFSTAFAQTHVPFYFAMNDEGMLQLADNGWKKISVKEVETEKAYLRGYFFKDPNKLINGDAAKTPSAVVVAKKKIRQNAVKQLLAKGILKNGDIVLSFRPNWEKTHPYPHIQMGISHAGLIYVENGVVKNLDMPLDEIHSGAGLNSSLDAKHYVEADALHIVRPRNFTAQKQKNLLEWIKLVKKNAAAIRSAGLLKFNGDYLAPKFDKYGPDDSFVTTMAKIILRQNKKSSDLTMYCSEFAWAMLSLANCSTAELLTETGLDASCVKPIFEPMPMVGANGGVGLTEGPLSVLENLDAGLTQKQDMLTQLFYSADDSVLSSNHRALANNPLIKMLIAMLHPMYGASLAGQTAVHIPVLATLPQTSNIPQPVPMVMLPSIVNSQAARNYSPTAFMINAMLDTGHPERRFDYVATIVFTPNP